MSPITEEKIKNLTLKQLFHSLTLGAWIWIIVGLVFILGVAYKLGYEAGIKQLAKENERSSVSQLSGEQRKLVTEIWKYQKHNSLSKVIITRDGFIFNDAEKKSTNINLISIVLPHVGDQQRFERVILSIPISFLIHLSETRWNSPYVVTIPDTARSELDKLIKEAR